ncbi:MAG TPA: hypothetical protein VG456_08370 [Candidatus Sulfopaludibacter sp.]|nr:hypothetical protein [Candidatus Sulfopaludibacter sp.]
MKALEVLVDGVAIGIYVPPSGTPFFASVANVPHTYMRGQVQAADDNEEWQWQLPDISEGQTISFRMVDAQPGSGVPPHRIDQRDPADVAECKRLAAEAYAQVLKRGNDQAPESD